MSCHAKKLAEPTYIQLSRAYESHKIFVYSSERWSGRIFLEILAMNVRNVTDEIGENENQPVTSMT